MSIRLFLPCCAAYWSLLSGCAQGEVQQNTLTGSQIDARVAHFVSTPAGGTTPTIRVSDDVSAPILRIRLLALQHELTDALDPLTHWARMTVVHGQQGLTTLASGFVLGARAGKIDNLDDFLDDWSGTFGERSVLAVQEAVVPRDVTATVDFVELLSGEKKWLPTEAIRLRALQSTGVNEGEGESTPGLNVSLTLMRQVLSQPKDTDASGMTPVRALLGSADAQAELVLMKEALLLGETLVFLLPSPFSSDHHRGLLIALQAVPAPTTGAAKEAHSALLTHCATMLEPDVMSAEQPPESRTSSNLKNLLDSSLEAASDPRRRRQALLALADTAGARLAADLILTASVETLARFAVDWQRSLRGVSPREDIAWLLESRAGHFLVALEADDNLPGELQSILMERAGEVGKWPSVLAEILGASTSIEVFDHQLLEANVVILEDNQAAARVRAFEWLTRTGDAPEGFDPLAPGRERRAALAQRSTDARQTRRGTSSTSGARVTEDES